MRSRFSSSARLLACAALLGGTALAQTPAPLTLPAGWVAAGSGAWRDSSGACLLRVQNFGRPFSVLTSEQQALALGGKLRKALTQSGMASVTTQGVGPTDSGLTPAGEWGVLAAYTYTQAEVRYQIVQLYFAQGGKLRTITGSHSEGEASACVNVMRDLLKGRR
ncbi:hypothetical protein [Deinococcus sp.]|uniref:hypothetical protein n=1 Tax=Deinococcus sp. TaxID=47478 RepID=UPI0025F81DB8|nr:hypothetical protein [Deinococcus sp.]